MKHKMNPALAVVLVVFFTATNSVFFKLANVPSMVFVSYRFLLCFLVFAIVLAIKSGKRKVSIKGVSRKRLVIMFFTGFIFSMGAFFYFIALKTTAISSVVILTSSNALFVVLFSRLFLKERISRFAFISLLIAFAGCILVLISRTGGVNSLTGNLCALLCAVCCAIYLVIMKKFAEISVPIKLSTTYAGSFVLAAAVAMIQGGFFVAYPAEEYLYMLGSSVIAICIPQSVINWAFRYVKAAFVGSVSLLEPIIGSFYAFLIWSETPGINQIIGGVLVLGGLFMYNNAEERARKGMLDEHERSLQAIARNP